MASKLVLATLFVRDIERARAFYTERLGMEVVPQFSSDEFIFLKGAGGSPIALQDLKRAPQGVTTGPGGFSLGFDVDDVDATLAAWKAAGVEMLSDVFNMGAGRIFYALDPDGNVLGISLLHVGVREYREQLGL